MQVTHAGTQTQSYGLLYPVLVKYFYATPWHAEEKHISNVFDILIQKANST